MASSKRPRKKAARVDDFLGDLSELLDLSLPPDIVATCLDTFAANTVTRHGVDAAAARDLALFVDRYCHIYDPHAEFGDWIPFKPWDSQKQVLRLMNDKKLLCILKARQLGATWMALAKALHTLLYKPGATVLMFSKRDDEAMEMLERLKGMYRRLPDKLKEPEHRMGAAHGWNLPNGSRALAFPTTGGDSYAATLAIVDEADLVPDLNKLLGSVKPTIDAGGDLILLGRVDKGKPESPFKKIYRAGVLGRNLFTPVFMPWSARPERTQKWYEDIKAESYSRTGSHDFLYEQYPATAEEALAPRELDKRIPPHWIRQCYEEAVPLNLEKLRQACKECGMPPSVPNLQVYAPPVKGRLYVLGVDPAEGTPNSDDSAIVVLDTEKGEEVANLYAKVEPTILGEYVNQIGEWYNHAPAMVERNNHGHCVLGYLKCNSRLRRLKGHDKNEGWLSNLPGKIRLYSAMADACRDQAVIIHCPKSYYQLESIEGDTLRAPEGQNDDAADAFALANVGLPQARHTSWRMEVL